MNTKSPKGIRVFVLFFLLLLVGCNKSSTGIEESNYPKYHDFLSFHDFKITLIHLSNIEDETIRNKGIQELWDSLKIKHLIPFAIGDSVAFLFSGAANTVYWAGDFNGWDPNESYKGRKVGLGSVWLLEKVFPSNARLDYKIVKDGNWILDPANDYKQLSGFGYNSELRMPDWIYPQETIISASVNRGQLSDNILIHSSVLNYNINYKVYKPYGYDGFSDLPVLYVTDGHEYANDQMGSLITVLDNLIFSHSIKPILAVFIDPRDPSNSSNNRRMLEYTGNINFANFVANELIPEIDALYKTNSSADSRAILGTSLGGWNAAYFGITKSDKFHLIGIHSPAFDPNIIQAYQDSSKLQLKIFMSTGVIYDTQDRARSMKNVMEGKGYPLLYKEVNEGHSWGNWRALMDEPLMYFFGN